jgi:hypothetical protein
MSRSIVQREAARLRKQRQRDRERDANRLAALARLEWEERAAEHLAPRVMREAVCSPPVRAPGEWLLSDVGMTWCEGEIIAPGKILVGPRVAIVKGIACRALAPTIGNNPLDKLSQSPLMTRTRRDAAELLQQDWSDVGSGLGVGAVDYLRSGGGTGGSNLAMLGQIEARCRLVGAATFAGAFVPGLGRVLLDCIPVSVWVTETDPVRTVGEGVAWIMAGLDKLAQFYWPPAVRSGGMPLMFGPSRGAYTIDVDKA